MRKVFVVGVGNTTYGKLPFAGRELAAEASREAIHDAGLDAARIEGAFVANAFGLAERQGLAGPLLMSALGIPDRPATTVEAACASGGAAFREAWLNVASGAADVFLAAGFEKVSHLDTTTATGYFSYGSDGWAESGNGATFPGLYATMARAHMQRYGTTEEQLARIAVKNHANAARNPKAHLPKTITVEDVMRSPYVAHPLKLYDACPFSDGGAAAVLASEEVARSLGKADVEVLGVGRAGSIASLADRGELTSIPASKLAAKQAFAQARLTREDIDLAEVHDCFTIAEVLATEDLGFFAPGEGAKAAEQGRTMRDGELPINVSGGLKAKGHPVGATGLGQIAELVLQLRGQAGARQVRDADVGLAHNVGATGGSCAVHILGRAR
jgi:acetyl-CoA C-acetyltransferase